MKINWKEVGFTALVVVGVLLLVPVARPYLTKVPLLNKL